jgi:phosphatidylglycerophosphatase A
MTLATGLYVGKIRIMPGTWGSLAALLPWLFIRDLPLSSYLLVLAAFFILGFFVSGSAEKILDTPDSECIVIDEFLGMFITLTVAPPHPAAWFIGFVFFRIFDIFKPFPVSWIHERIHGGIGIMMDDVMAGLYAFLALQLIWWGIVNPFLLH